ncbi:MAG: hypothetical protein K6B70_02070 [Clostridia bacterium]|nr:hypothetical protein [Clostridia bacterium]
MEALAIIIISIVTLILCAVLFKVNLKNLKRIKEIGEDKELNAITNLLPENEQVCKDILSLLGNDKVKVKIGEGNSKTSLYLVATNSIVIANIKDTFTRIQTIAHECIHSVQDKRLLWFNFIFSNIYLIYFVVITVLTLFNKIPFVNICVLVLVGMSAVLYIVRSHIEADAMIKARYIAEKYMETKTDLISKEDIDIVVENYDRINNDGVKLYSFSLLFGYVSKIIIYCVVSMI